MSGIRDWGEYIPWDEGLACVVAFVAVVLPLVAYHDHPGVFGDDSTVKVLGIVALGGTATFCLYAGAGRRLLAVVPGLAAGLGVAALFVFHVAERLPPGNPMNRLELLITLVIGAAPGLFLMWVLRRIVDSRSGQ